MGLGGRWRRNTRTRYRREHPNVCATQFLVFRIDTHHSTDPASRHRHTAGYTDTHCYRHPRTNTHCDALATHPDADRHCDATPPHSNARTLSCPLWRYARFDCGTLSHFGTSIDGGKRLAQRSHSRGARVNHSDCNTATVNSKTRSAAAKRLLVSRNLPMPPRAIAFEII